MADVEHGPAFSGLMGMMPGHCKMKTRSPTPGRRQDHQAPESRLIDRDAAEAAQGIPCAQGQPQKRIADGPASSRGSQQCSRLHRHMARPDEGDGFGSAGPLAGIAQERGLWRQHALAEQIEARGEEEPAEARSGRHARAAKGWISDGLVRGLPNLPGLGPSGQPDPGRASAASTDWEEEMRSALPLSTRHRDGRLSGPGIHTHDRVMDFPGSLDSLRPRKMTS